MTRILGSISLVTVLVISSLANASDPASVYCNSRPDDNDVVRLIYFQVSGNNDEFIGAALLKTVSGFDEPVSQGTLDADGIRTNESIKVEGEVAFEAFAERTATESDSVDTDGSVGYGWTQVNLQGKKIAMRCYYSKAH